MKQNEDILLHKKITKHSNLMIPFSDHVTGFEFPEQNKELLNTTVTLKYRDRYFADRESVNIPSSGRPADDEPFVEADIKDGDDNIIHKANFKILRADIGAPNRYIAVSLDYRHVVVGVTENDGFLSSTIYPVTMMQMSEYIGLVVSNMYLKFHEKTKGVVIAADEGEPCMAVIMEYRSDNEVRFVLGDECFSAVKAYIDKDGEEVELQYIEQIRAYEMNRTMREIMQLRESLLSDITIWSPEEKEETNEEI